MIEKFARARCTPLSTGFEHLSHRERSERVSVPGEGLVRVIVGVGSPLPMGEGVRERFVLIRECSSFGAGY